jgi:hypothetical protein
MTLHVYSCETATIRSEVVKRTKPDGEFYGLRMHMNTDQAITVWSRSREELQRLVASLQETVQHAPVHEQVALPGQMGS